MDVIVSGILRSVTSFKFPPESYICIVFIKLLGTALTRYSRLAVAVLGRVVGPLPVDIPVLPRKTTQHPRSTYQSFRYGVIFTFMRYPIRPAVFEARTISSINEATKIAAVF